MGDPPASTAPAQALGFLYVGGALLGVLTLAVDKHPETPLVPLLALAAVAGGAGSLMLLRPRSFGRRRLDALCAAGTVILGVGCTLAGPNAYGVMFLWTGMYAVAYLPDTARRHLALVAIALAASFALADHNDQQPFAAWTIILGGLVMAALIVGRLLDRLEIQGRRLAARAADLSRSEHRLRAMLESAHDGFVAMDADGVLVDLNEVFARMLGRRRADLLGRPFASVALAEHERERHHERRARLVAGGGFEPFEVDFLRADGSVVRGLVSGSALHVRGEPLVAGFVRDLSLRDEAAREHRIAETLQRSLLPERLPDLTGVALAARYVPAAAEADVGGDWYDAVELPGGALALAMGDVVGKGLGAAASVGRLRSALRAYALEHRDPAVVLDRLERALVIEDAEADMTTATLVVVDVEERLLRWASAGHPPPLLVEPSGRTTWLEGGRSAPIGADAPGRRCSATAPLPPDATILLYTDGLVERRDVPLQTGLDTLREGAVRSCRDDPGSLVDELLRRAGVTAGGADDVAILAARVHPIGDRLALDLATRAEELSRLRAALRRWLAEHGQDDADLVLAATEAASNAVEHTRGPADGRFHVDAWTGAGETVVEVRSAGHWRPRQEPRADRGRGLMMMEALVEDVAVRTDGDTTTVRLLRRRR